MIGLLRCLGCLLGRHLTVNAPLLRLLLQGRNMFEAGQPCVVCLLLGRHLLLVTVLQGAGDRLHVQIEFLGQTRFERIRKTSEILGVHFRLRVCHRGRRRNFGFLQGDLIALRAALGFRLLLDLGALQIDLVLLGQRLQLLDHLLRLLQLLLQAHDLIRILILELRRQEKQEAASR